MCCIHRCNRRVLGKNAKISTDTWNEIEKLVRGWSGMSERAGLRCVRGKVRLILSVAEPLQRLTWCWHEQAEAQCFKTTHNMVQRCIET